MYKDEIANFPNIVWGNKPPTVSAGLGVPFLTYASGRTGVSVTHWGGLNEIVYYGDGPMMAPPTFFSGNTSSAYVRVFRLQIVVEDRAYNPELCETTHFPFGYSSSFRVDDLDLLIGHHLTLISDAVIQTVEIHSNPNKLLVRVRVEHHTYTKHETTGDLERTWSEWTEAPECCALTCIAADHVAGSDWELRERASQTLETVETGPDLVDLGPPSGETHIALFTDGTLFVKNHRERLYAESEPFLEGSRSITLLFANEYSSLVRRIGELRCGNSEIAHAVELDFRERTAAGPSMTCGNDVVSSLFANSPGTVRSLFVPDQPGAMRASSLHYWVWGWDTMMCAESLSASGNIDLTRDILRFYRDTAHPDYGIGHQFTRDFKIRIPQAPAAQCLYLIVLYGYESYSSDSLLAETYKFARDVFIRALASCGEQGLATGPALWPDFPVFAGHTGNDWSTLNNSILYQGSRCMQTLAAMSGDEETCELASKCARRLEGAFADEFWDSEREYFVDSVDSITNEKRHCYPAHAILWQSPFCDDLLDDMAAPCAGFIKQNLLTPRGFLPYARWDSAFNGDHNQLGQAWPATDVFETRCLAAVSDQESLSLWLSGVEWFWKQLTIPEAYTMVTINDSGTPDAPGGKQPFSAKSWYMALISSVAGINIDIGGVTLGPGYSEPTTINHYRWRNKLLNFECSGSGNFPAFLTVNGNEVRGSCKAPIHLLTDSNTVDVVYRRSEKCPEFPALISLHGGTVLDVTVNSKSELSAIVEAMHPVWLRFSSPSKPAVTLSGVLLDCEFNTSSNVGRVLLQLAKNRQSDLTIVC